MPTKIFFEKEKIEADIAAGLTRVQIAEKYNCEKSTISNFCKKNNIKLKSGIPVGRKTIRFLNFDSNELLRLYQIEDKSSSDLAKIFNVNKTTILRKLKLIGIAVNGKEKRKTTVKTGCKASAWRGGVTPVRNLIRKMKEYKNWTISVFKRDNFTCQKCKKQGGNLNAHHIKFFSTILNENNISSRKEARSCVELWNLSNGITLCKSCHDNIHYTKGED